MALKIINLTRCLLDVPQTSISSRIVFKNFSMIKLVTNQGCVLVYRYARTAPKSVFSAGLRVRCKALSPKPDRIEPQMLK